MTNITEIEPGLWQGGYPDGDIPKNIDIVVNLRRDPASNKFCSHLSGALWMPTEDGVFHGFKWLDTIVDYITSCREKGLTVLVHCMAGVSRSTLVTAAYFMRKYHMTATQALDTIGAKRPVIGPLPSYRTALHDYEVHIGLRS